MGWAPNSVKRVRTAASAIAEATSARSLSTTARGTARGARKANHAADS